MILCYGFLDVMIGRMKPPLFVRPLTDEERAALRAGLRSPDAFTLRRCQLLLASADGLKPGQIAERFGCASQTVRNAIRAFEAAGTDCLGERSHRPRSARPAIDDGGCERLRALLHRSPRDFGKPTSLWTLGLAAEVAFAEGITARRVSHETIRRALKRLGVGWKRAKTWITSPDPAYLRKKTRGTG
jgi:transposase